MMDDTHNIHRQWYLNLPPERQDQVIPPAEFDRYVGPHFRNAPKDEQRDARDRAIQAQLIGWGLRPGASVVEWATTHRNAGELL